ncbi:MAG: hypothetical protein CL947_01275 [Epsilonproteobacteria bacterium]|nr:hypothetical protein [Campylobacterota bacterium]|tara:strand:+ start:605 stop:1141 length:537 start_codon:yes stop_codon:yes gene_type:complete
MLPIFHNFLEFSYKNLSENALSISMKTLTVLTIIIGGYFAEKFIINALKHFLENKKVNKHSALLIRKIIRYSINLLLIILILQNLGVEISPLIGALGISGVALSFGMKDMISNIIAGMLIMAYQQFKVGDEIKIKDWQGKVIDINIRYTTLQTEEMTVFVPNSVLYSTTVAIIKPKNF